MKTEYKRNVTERDITWSELKSGAYTYATFYEGKVASVQLCVPTKHTTASGYNNTTTVFPTYEQLAIVSCLIDRLRYDVEKFEAGELGADFEREVER